MNDLTTLDNEPHQLTSASTAALVTSAEIDQQIATAKKYPRSIVQFRNRVQSMVTLSEAIAEECIYVLPRKKDGKDVNIEGPSARFAEIIVNAWGNSRAGARVVDEGEQFVTAQGVFHDLEANVALTYEVQRRITDSKGRRYKADMVGVTANAACSIALRNAILKGVPKAFWSEMYEGARSTVLGDVKTLPTRRADVLAKLQQFGVKPDQVFAKLKIQGVEDIMQEHLLLLRGVMQAMRDGDTTPEDAFASDEETAPAERQRKEPKPRTAQAPGTPPAAHPAIVSAGGAPRDPEAPKERQESDVARSHVATDSEKDYVKKRCGTFGVDLAFVMREAGISDFENLTADGFIALKEALRKFG